MVNTRTQSYLRLLLLTVLLMYSTFSGLPTSYPRADAARDLPVPGAPCSRTVTPWRKRGRREGGEGGRGEGEREEGERRGGREWGEGGGERARGDKRRGREKVGEERVQCNIYIKPG